MASFGAAAGDSIGVAGNGSSTGSLWIGVPVGGSGIGKRVQVGGVPFTSLGVPVTGASSGGGGSATTSRWEEGAEGTVGDEEGGEFIVVHAVGLGVRLVHTPVERVGCSEGVAADVANGTAGRQSLPLPGGGKGGVPSGCQLLHRCQGSQLEQSHLVSLHSQLVKKPALHLASLVQLQHNAKVSLWWQ